ncbi:MAG: AAA family ATPase, partial [Chloroflexi bacterium]|nr:AAA family ATPase [Chloroflexota bacterium]
MPAIELTPDQLLRICDPAVFDFETTASLPQVSRIIGQARGVGSIEFGLDIDSPGYNVYILGEGGTGRDTALEHFLRSRALARPVPPDWAYVYNFAEPHKPRALRLPPGTAHRFAAEMETLISRVRVALPAAFEREEYEAAAEQIGRRLATGR